MSERNHRKLFEATEAFAPDGYTTIRKGELVREGHPLLDQFPDLFREAKPRFEWDVEQATSAPGERRGAKARV